MDLLLWVDITGQVHFSHYSKPVANKGVVWQSSALSCQVKRNILFNEGLRRLKNCHPDLSWTHKAELLTDLNLRMRQAGHSTTYRSALLHRILSAYNTLLDKYQKGENIYQTQPKPKTNERNWFKKSGYHSTAAVPVTADAQLKTQLTAAIKNDSWNIKLTRPS